VPQRNAGEEIARRDEFMRRARVRIAEREAIDEQERLNRQR